jgi:hypothetical protein
VTEHLKARTHNPTTSMAADLSLGSAVSALKATQMIICGINVRADTMVDRIGMDSSFGYFEVLFQGSLRQPLEML